MANRRLAIPSEDVQLVLVGPVNFIKASRVQRVTVNNDIPTTDIYELGSSSTAGTVQDTPNVTVTFSVFDVGIKVFGTLAGKSTTAFPIGGASISDLGEADVVVYVQDETVAKYVKSMSAKRLQVRDFAFNYTVDGESTEDYTLIGSEKRWFKNDVIVDRFTAPGTSFTLTYTPLVLKNGNYAVSVILDGVYLTEVTGAPAATGEYQIVGTTLTTFDTLGSQILIVYHANPGGTPWVDVSELVDPAAVRGRDVGVKISANSIDRVQSVTINGTLNVQPVREMHNRNIVGYQAQVPTVEGTITVLDTDTELISLITTGVISGVGVTEYTVGDQCPSSGVSLKIEILDPCDTTVPYTVVKTVYVDEIIPVGESWTSNVNNNATQTFNWRAIHAHLVVYSGGITLP
jgi:hypothetical protein